VKARLGIAALALAAPVAAGGVAAADGTAPRAARTVTVTVGDDFYRPARLTVARRTRVRWVWRGRDVHNVTVTSGPRRFSSPTQRRGTFARTLRARGRYRIVCTVHGQAMRIRVR
jgi:plastocyanin